MLFFTKAGSEDELYSARLLVESLREFGGQLSSCPIWLFDFHASGGEVDHQSGLDVETISARVPESMKGYELADKVHSCAEAERLAPPHIESLVWISPDNLFVSPPDLYILGDSHDVAVRPVHVKNVGLAIGEPLDTYWSRIFEIAGIELPEFSVESYVDRRHLRGYFNSHSYCVKPALGLFRRWSECFEMLLHDGEFQTSSCSEELRRVFLHQAILSALTLSMVNPDRIRILPPSYCYPYNLQEFIPQYRRAASATELVSIVYEDRSLDPAAMTDIKMERPLESWLADRLAERGGRRGPSSEP